MNSKLKYVQNWLELARETNWSVSNLAKHCGVSTRTLERYFFKTMCKSPKKWLKAQRQCHASELLHNGLTVKETAAELGFQYPHHFSREFKENCGYSPNEQSDFQK